MRHCLVGGRVDCKILYIRWYFLYRYIGFITFLGLHMQIEPYMMLGIIINTCDPSRRHREKFKGEFSSTHLCHDPDEVSCEAVQCGPPVLHSMLVA
jgi:hypothetical protein